MKIIYTDRYGFLIWGSLLLAAFWTFDAFDRETTIGSLLSTLCAVWFAGVALWRAYRRMTVKRAGGDPSVIRIKEQ
ncbi:MAG: hypothetical protein ACTHKM_05180, partial [Tsuneonella sp.]